MKSFLIRVLIIVAVATAAAAVHGSVGGLKMPKEAGGGLPSDIREQLAEQRAAQSAQQSTAQTVDPVVADSGEEQVEPAAPAHSAESEGDMTCEDLHEAWASGMVTLVDARPVSDYVEGHIPDAFSVPYEDFSARWPLFEGIITPDQTIVVYCDGGDCHASENLASLLLELGYENVVVYRLGFESWVSKGFEVAVGEPML